ncbi:hypothetical protein S7711_01359 [Stachybotrys chartarum IBT 7711]|uniref:DUF6546 domain-containing protein n=1 Tax=Stachybotrys chartarum (strain CBS 109288 / IBT 7711) TaxID=1280523 RepID=A0A084BBU1_STACB|nr:hypothetical protein S7711_01359 [Stachybotrys chartarum IBT 7711]KFA51853.1 hypothetical protein S40293_04118 [Stachybotrys chartarum IBT 40293]
MSGSSWASLPPEIRLQILEVVSRQGSRGSGAAVCSEWKTFIEPQNFHRLELQVPCLEQLPHMTTRTTGLVRQIRLNIELPRYSCRSCQWPESRSHRFVLELNTFSPSDSEHWFKNYCIGLDAQIDGVSEQQQQQQQAAPVRWHDPNHGWIDGRQIDSPSADAMSRLFAPICLSLPESIPKVNAVTRLVIRRECRRQIIPPVLRLLLQRLPRLQTMVYEPWRACRRNWKIACDEELASVIQDALPSHVEMLSIFEDPNYELVSAMRRDPLFEQVIDDNMTAVSFMIDAQQILDFLQSTHCCHKLRSLTLTASILKRESQSTIASFLSGATLFPQEMKQLERLILWNSKRGEACALIYQRDRSSQLATLTWRGTWHFELNHEVVESWKKVDPDLFLRVEYEQLQAVIKHNGDAIYHLRLPGGVIDPVSVRQLQQEAFVEEEG